MPTPKQGYWLNGKRLLSTTTPIGAYNPDGNDGLINWAVRLALGPDREPLVDHRYARDQAADIGTMAHAAAEAWAKKEQFKFEGDPEITGPAQIASGAFREWISNNRITVTHTELRLMSRKYGYGGTIDAAGHSGNGLRILLDWKTSNYLKGTMAFQLAAYESLWNENFPEDPVTGGVHLLRLDKQRGTFNHLWLNDLENELQCFLMLKDLYGRYKITKRKMGL